MEILVFDNYDSFTYNLVHLVEKITNTKPHVIKNDVGELDDFKDYDRIILSPGPGIPSEAGMLLPLIKKFAGIIPILGVCLGHQAIAEAFGGKLQNLNNVFHGLGTPVKKTGILSPLFKGLSETFIGGRYHSWIVDRDALPACFEVTAVDDDQQIMAMQHKEYDLQGVQFHPESILTPQGELIMRNWLNSN